jgi:plastocyanin
VHRRRFALAALVTTALLAAGCGSDSGGGSAKPLPADGTIGMKSLHFKPDHVQVKVGQTVTWKNEESVPHDVKADSGASFASKTFGKEGTYAFTPAKAGTIEYECTLHPGMDGTLDVVAK